MATAPPARKYTANQVAYEALQAGFQGDDAVIAVAVAMVESGGNINALNDNPATGDLSYGLWQINMIGALGPERRKLFGIANNEQLFGSAVNAKAAKILRDTPTGWNHWSTYKSGAYRAYMVLARMAVNSPDNTGIVVGADQPGGVITQVDLLKPLKDLVAWMIKELSPFFLRVAGFIGGGLLVVVGVVLYVRGQVK